MNYKPYIIFLVLIGAGIGIMFLISQGYYPIAVIQNSFLSERAVSEEYRAAATYYKNMVKTYGSLLNDSGTLADVDIKISVMDQIIEDMIIRDEARKELGGDLATLIDNKVSQYAGDETLAKAATALYGLNDKAFMANILVPQATREILMGRLFLKGEKIEDWLVSAKKSARVIIFSPQFKWDGKQVISE
ncbi:MAG: hypothetical protein Q8P49_03345 [Candidatus Liptonbacteria bacterium]|nr:hypothetical protein [Candidatus Liptonbacteria bacterium]